jgi:hypothetical protein
LIANGSDVAIFDVEVVDKDGNRCPTALNMINFTLHRPGRMARRIAQGPDNYILSKTLPVEGGVNRVMIRSTTKAEKLNCPRIGWLGRSMTIIDSNHSSARLACRHHSFQDSAGFLGRGPTPRGESLPTDAHRSKRSTSRQDPTPKLRATHRRQRALRLVERWQT